MGGEIKRKRIVTDEEAASPEPVIGQKEWNEALEIEEGSARVWVGPEEDKDKFLAKIKGRIYISLDTKRVFFDDGEEWKSLGYLSSVPPAASLKELKNLYWDPVNKEIVIITE